MIIRGAIDISSSTCCSSSSCCCCCCCCCVFGGCWPVPAVRNSTFRRFLSNPPKIVSHSALPLPNFLDPRRSEEEGQGEGGRWGIGWEGNSLQNHQYFLPFSTFWPFSGQADPPKLFYGKIQYLTARSRPVIPSPRDRRADILKFTSFLVVFQPSLFASPS